MFLIFIITIFITGCGNSYKQYELEVVMPSLPEHVENCYGNIKFKLKYPGYESNWHYDEYSLVDPCSSVFITSSLSILPVVAIPYISIVSDTENYLCDSKITAITFYPAGGIFPEGLNNEKLFLKWEDGFAAEIIYKMVNNSYNIDSFNVGRFKNYLAEKSLSNPWIFDEENIIYALSFNIFNANFVKKKKSHEIILNLPQVFSSEWGWILSNLTDKRIFASDNGVIILNDIPERNFFILSDNGKDFAELFLDSSGWSAYFSNCQEILSGSW